MLRDDSDDSGMTQVGWDRANRGRYGHGRDTHPHARRPIHTGPSA